MKQRTSCQFASPLDCDIHSQPEVRERDYRTVLFFDPNLTTCFCFCFLQAVVLEGKYWKRDYNVISAEYKKWRRFYHRTIDPNNALESVSLSYTRSELQVATL